MNNPLNTLLTETQPLYTELYNNKLLLGIGRQYSASEKTIIRKYAKANNYTVPTNCAAGIYTKHN